MSNPKRLILLVEDDPLVRWLACDELEAAGYDVVEAENAQAALDILKARPEIGLLFTDVNMPGALDGMALAETVHRRWPEVRLVVTSGRGLDRRVPDAGAFLLKPYTTEELYAAIIAAGDVPPRDIDS